VILKWQEEENQDQDQEDITAQRGEDQDLKVQV
jgi:hypothetical protein